MLRSTKEDNVMSNIKQPPEGGITKIPMNPADLPQQKIYEVKSLPILPAGCAVEIMNYEREHTLPGIPKKPTKKSIPLGQVEWSWSPMNARVDSYCGVEALMIILVTISATGMRRPACLLKGLAKNRRLCTYY
jgi:hypothetical protein